MKTKPDLQAPADEPALDAHLRTALRHAPDHGALPPAALSARILSAAAEAVARPGAGRAEHAEPIASLPAAVPRRWGERALAWLDGLQRPAVAGAFASLVLATVLVIAWRDTPLPGVVPELPAKAPAHARLPAPAVDRSGATATQAPATTLTVSAAAPVPLRSTAPAEAAAPPTDLAARREAAPAAAPSPTREERVLADAGTASPQPGAPRDEAATASPVEATPAAPPALPAPPAPPAPFPATALASLSPDAVLADAAPAPAAATAAPMSTPPTNAATAAAPALVAAVTPRQGGSTAALKSAVAPAPADPLAAAITTFGAVAARSRSAAELGGGSAADGADTNLAAGAPAATWLSELRDVTKGRWQAVAVGRAAPSRAVTGPDGRLLGRIDLFGTDVVWQAAEGGPAWQASLPAAAAARLAQQLETSPAAP